jgi:hypothetical protein
VTTPRSLVHSLGLTISLSLDAGNSSTNSFYAPISIYLPDARWSKSLEILPEVHSKSYLNVDTCREQAYQNVAGEI